MKAPVGLLSDRTVLHSKMEGPRPDKFAFVEQSGTMKEAVAKQLSEKIMHKTRNLFRANGSKRVPGFCLDGMPCGARGFYLLVYPAMPCSAGS